TPRALRGSRAARESMRRRVRSGISSRSGQAAEKDAPQSCFHRSTLERKQAARAFLNEEDKKDEYCNLRKHRAGSRLQKFVRDPKCEGGDKSSPKGPNSPEDHDHEAVDDVGLAEIRRDIVDLRECDTGDARDP